MHARAPVRIPVADFGDGRDLELGEGVERARGEWRAGGRAGARGPRFTSVILLLTNRMEYP